MKKSGSHGDTETQKRIKQKNKKIKYPFRVFVSLCEIKDFHAVTVNTQVLTYFKPTGMKLGYLLNFDEAMMKDGIYRIINGIIV